MHHWACGEDSSVSGVDILGPGSSRSRVRKVCFWVGRPLRGSRAGTLETDPTHEP